MNYYRQGDVSLHEIIDGKVEFYDKTEIIDFSKLKKIVVKDRFVLAYGEATGHNHAILDRPETKKFEVFQDEKGRHVLHVVSPVILAHIKGENETTADHFSQTVKQGWYIQEQETEFDPFEQKVKKIID